MTGVPEALFSVVTGVSLLYVSGRPRVDTEKVHMLVTAADVGCG